MNKRFNKVMSKLLTITLLVTTCGTPINGFGQETEQSDIKYNTVNTTPSQILVTTPSMYVAGTTYYVDNTTGNDAADGITEATAWKTLEKLNTHTFQAGDTILLNGTFEDAQLKPKGSGASGNPITIKSKASKSAKINANGKHLATVLMENVEHWVVEDLEITNDDNLSVNNIDSGISTDRDTAVGNPGRRIGIHLTIDERKDTFKAGQKVYKDITIRNCHVHDVDGDEHKRQNKVNGGMGAEVLFDPANGVFPHFDGITLEGNTIERVGRTGIKTVRLTDLTVERQIKIGGNYKLFLPLFMVKRHGHIGDDTLI